VLKYVRDAKIPGPESFISRLLGTVIPKAFLSTSGRGGAYFGVPPTTLFGTGSPNTTIPGSFSMLGRIPRRDLDIPTMEVTPRGVAGQLPPPRTMPPSTLYDDVFSPQQEVQPLAPNRQLPAAGRTTGPQTVGGPSQYGISAPETTTGPRIPRLQEGPMLPQGNIPITPGVSPTAYRRIPPVALDPRVRQMIEANPESFRFRGGKLESYNQVKRVWEEFPVQSSADLPPRFPAR